MHAALSAEPAGAGVRPASTGELALDARRGRRPLVRHRVAVALAATALGTLAFTSYAALADRAIAALMAIVLVMVAVTDLERRVIPNRVILPGLAIVLAARIATSPGHALEWVLGAVGAALVFLLPNLINPSAMGMGDVKLAAFLGAGLGTAVIGALLVAFLSIFPFALATLIRGGRAARKAALPFGPFLAFGGLLILILPHLLGLGGS